MKSQISVAFDYENILLLQKEQNRSALINSLVTKYYSQEKGESLSIAPLEAEIETLKAAEAFQKEADAAAAKEEEEKRAKEEEEEHSQNMEKWAIKCEKILIDIKTLCPTMSQENMLKFAKDFYITGCRSFNNVKAYLQAAKVIP